MSTTLLTRPTPRDASTAGAVRPVAGIGATLVPIHAAWLDEVRLHLLPACDPCAGFWPRWTAVRYLADRFAHDFGTEAELLDVLIGEVEPRAARRLTEDRQALETLRHALDWIGRRRGTGIAAAAIAGTLLQTLRRWCAELELALWSRPPEGDPPRAAALLARLARAGGVRADSGAQARRADLPGAEVTRRTGSG